MTKELFDTIMDEELYKIREQMGEQRYRESKFELASSLFRDMTIAEQFESFLTNQGYAHLN